MKTYPMLNETPCLKDLRGSGGIARRIRIFRVTPRPLYPGERARGSHWLEDWLGPRTGLDAVAKRKIPYRLCCWLTKN